ncbi:hypothetical protein ACOMICROBIO_LMKGKHOH_02658 [Vibrio sp. B1FIG11]|nr:hypothetical protein A1Q_3493 [Vibrio campbellii HY01]CAD7809728.1 hypothetical protein ACOMICROBIO_LMKGKHOH_02658 [Vibrio sp. B1FIG11]CAE6910101.1 hypothetical protein ACOMICROBIO_LMKGKHOH_02658 [Vibrio sp. B1FIG11]
MYKRKGNDVTTWLLFISKPINASMSIFDWLKFKQLLTGVVFE